MPDDEPSVADPGAPRQVLVADEVWVATALLHREHPEREGFSAREIEVRARREAMTPRHRPGVYAHAIQHCVANRPASPNRQRMLFAVSRSQRRLFRPGDPFHPQRAGGRMLPERGDLPARYRPLLDWYANTFAPGAAAAAQAGGGDPILGLRGVGRDLWRGETADDYVARLRGGWK